MSGVYRVRASTATPRCAEECEAPPGHAGDYCSHSRHPRPRPGVEIETVATFEAAQRTCRRMLARLGIWDTKPVEAVAAAGGVIGPFGATTITVEPLDRERPDLPVGVSYRIEEFRDADWPSAAQIAAVNARVESGGRFDRTWSCFDLRSCSHALSQCIEVAGWEVEVCTRCGHATTIGCTHPAGFVWNEPGTLLRCRTCGSDGT